MAALNLSGYLASVRRVKGWSYFGPGQLCLSHCEILAFPSSGLLISQACIQEWVTGYSKAMWYMHSCISTLGYRHVGAADVTGLLIPVHYCLYTDIAFSGVAPKNDI
jgi:hypothetical protein